MMRPLLGHQVAHIGYSGPLPTLRHLCRLPSPNVVHAHLTLSEFLCCLAFIRSPGVGIVATRHIAAPRGSSPLGRTASKLVRRRLNAQIAPSQFVADRVDGPCVVVVTGVPDAPLGPHNSQVVLVAQRLEPEKDTKTALEAWAKCPLRSSGWQLQIAGTGSEDSRLRELAQSLGILSTCTFLGHVEGVSALMSEAAIVMCSAPAEPFGLTAAEAMACGAPVVATGAGGHLETVGRSADALIFAPGDASRAAHLLEELGNDIDRRRRYGMALRRLQQENLSLDSFASTVEEVYDSLPPAALASNTIGVSNG